MSVPVTGGVMSLSSDMKGVQRVIFPRSDKLNEKAITVLIVPHLFY
jgi:hypothetical protein